MAFLFKTDSHVINSKAQSDISIDELDRICRCEARECPSKVLKLKSFGQNDEEIVRRAAIASIPLVYHTCVTVRGLSH